MPYKPTGSPPGRPKKKVQHIIGDMPKLADYQWAALAKEYQGVKDWEREPWPSETPAPIVATAAGKTRQIVYRWRKDPAYRRGLIWLGSTELDRLLDAEKKESIAPFNSRQRDALLATHVTKHWTGPIKSPLDGRVYPTIDKYVVHLIEAEVIPYDDAKARYQKGVKKK